MNYLINKLYTNKRNDCLSSSEVVNALDKIHKDYVVVLIDALVCKRLYASAITKELGLCKNSSADTYNNTGSLSANDIN